LGLAFQLLLAERRQGHAKKADAFGDREQWLEQRVAKLLDFGSRRKERRTGPASRDLLEIGLFHFQCHRAPANLSSLASAPDLFDEGHQARRPVGDSGWPAGRRPGPDCRSLYGETFNTQINLGYRKTGSLYVEFEFDGR
jgi:hypothetical protein